ncbi:hypothetical protein NFI96_024542 [Prochilodus magdalenae]|nr:hypothetical protein NFI96_024542 [Prochilodus magdalenae]
MLKRESWSNMIKIQSRAKEREQVKHAKEREQVKHAKEREQVKHAKEREQVKHAKERESRSNMLKREQVKHAKEREQVKHAKEREQVKHAKEREQVKHAKEREQCYSVENCDYRAVHVSCKVYGRSLVLAPPLHFKAPNGHTLINVVGSSRMLLSWEIVASSFKRLLVLLNILTQFLQMVR